ncbi:MAG: hypothetical protein KF799_08250 [Bdellovibrionales bacterium]|nr:hypothetical protein [Bdellovibrionales bacterium]
MMPVLGVPILEIWLEALYRLGLRDILIASSQLSETVDKFIQLNERPLRLHIARGAEALGSGAQLFAHRSFIGDDDVMVVQADHLSLFPGRLLIESFERRPTRAVATMMTCDSQTGAAVKTDSRGLVYEIGEASGLRQTPTGVYIFSRRFLSELFSTAPVNDITTEVLPRLMGRINEFHNSEYHRELNTLDLYMSACRDICQRRGLARQIDPQMWPRFEATDLHGRWLQMWEGSGVRSARISTLSALNGELHGPQPPPQALLIDRLTVGEIPALQKLAVLHNKTAFIPWCVE